eukprot:CAMPEP_0182911482 /NCGR_PEP_ID=MMETSP0034_2-20130328/36950_1 /TAXON_ID=156128 /ORGANISM="Nephroselmis pyriformis, Strain CCMP717" /LENGTH=78 /DNA_ID=CAMNT_0025048009 /DNA_START=146 /DNA_END=379 /DNA_ORIENTATION=-
MSRGRAGGETAAAVAEHRSSTRGNVPPPPPRAVQAAGHAACPSVPGMRSHLVEHAVKLVPGLPDTVAIVGVHNENQAL